MKGWLPRGFQKESARRHDPNRHLDRVVRRMPTGFRVMHPSSGPTLAELLLSLSAELKQGASYIR